MNIDPLGAARRRAHENLRAQAAERARMTIGAHGARGADANRGGFDPGHHPIYDAINAARARSLQGVQRAEPGLNQSAPAAPFNPGIHGFGGPSEGLVGSLIPPPQAPQAPILPRLPESASGRPSEGLNPLFGGAMRSMQDQFGLQNNLIHLGQGLFLHPGTGEIHGFGPSGPVTGFGGVGAPGVGFPGHGVVA